MEDSLWQDVEARLSLRRNTGSSENAFVPATSLECAVSSMSVLAMELTLTHPPPVQRGTMRP